MGRIVDRAIPILGNTLGNEHVLHMLEEHCGQLVPFVGAGLSVGFGYPQWKQFLETAADQMGLRPKIDSLLALNRFEDAADVLTADRPNTFNDILQQTFGQQRIQRPLGKGAVRHVASVARGLVLTTNFDRVLEIAFEDAGLRFDEVFPGSQIREASYAIEVRKRVLLKLHGDYYSPTHRVLTAKEYAREYGGTDSCDIELPLPTILAQAFGAGPLLFLGCSLQNDRTTRVIAKIAKKLAGTVHFALLSASECTDERLRELDSWNIRPLFFPAGKFAKIEEFLGCLADASALGRVKVPGSAGKATASVNNPQELVALIKDPVRLDQMGRALIEGGRWEEAWLFYSKLVELTATSSERMYARGNEGLAEICWHREKWEEADRFWAIGRNFYGRHSRAEAEALDRRIAKLKEDHPRSQSR
ncbi:MAG TPA: SIR2 family protein [Acidobacteriota bacterium]|nr:SIR2 family protein [Acidobacteriota bacterium]